MEKVNYLLENPAERDKIAKAGQARTLRDHTFFHRAEYINELIHLKTLISISNYGYFNKSYNSR